MLLFVIVQLQVLLAAPKMTSTSLLPVVGKPSLYRYTLIGDPTSYVSFDDSHGLVVQECKADDKVVSSLKAQCKGMITDCNAMLKVGAVGILPDRCGGRLIKVTSTKDSKLFILVNYTLTSLDDLMKSPSRQTSQVHVIADYSNNKDFFGKQLLEPYGTGLAGGLQKRGLKSFVTKVGQFIKDSLLVKLDKSQTYSVKPEPVKVVLASGTKSCMSETASKQGFSRVNQLSAFHAEATFTYEAQVQFGVRAIGQLFPPKLDEGYVYVRAQSSISASFDLDANLFTEWQTKLKLPEFPITPFEIPGVVSIGPLFGVDLDVQAALAIQAKLNYQTIANLGDVYMVAGKIGGQTHAVSNDGNPLLNSKLVGSINAYTSTNAESQNKVTANGRIVLGLTPHIGFGISCFGNLLNTEVGLKGTGSIIANFGGSTSLGTQSLVASGTSEKTVNNNLKAAASFNFALYYGFDLQPFVSFFGTFTSLLDGLRYSTGTRVLYSGQVTPKLSPVQVDSPPSSPASSVGKILGPAQNIYVPTVYKRQLPKLQVQCLNLAKQNSAQVNSSTQKVKMQSYQDTWPKYGILSDYQYPANCPFVPKVQFTSQNGIAKRSLVASRLFKRAGDCELQRIQQSDPKFIFDRRLVSSGVTYLISKHVLTSSGFADVVKGRREDADPGKFVVVKELYQTSQFPDEDDFMDEIRALKAAKLYVSHEYDYQTSTGIIIQHFVDGELMELEYQRVKGYLTQCQKFQTFYLVQLREFMLKNSMVHQDAHTENAIRKPDGSVQFIDFDQVTFKDKITPYEGETVDEVFLDLVLSELQRLKGTFLKCYKGESQKIDLSDRSLLELIA